MYYNGVEYKIYKVMNLKIKKYIRKFFDALNQSPVMTTVILSCTLTFFIEILARHSLFGAIAYVIKNPFIYAYNCVIILFTLSVALYFSKRSSVYMTVCFFWVVLGVVNSILLGIRGTPLSAIDFTVLKSAYTLIKLYISIPLLALLIVLAIGVIAAIVILFVKAKKLRPAYFKGITVTIVSAVMIFFTSQSLVTSESVTTSSGDLTKIYEKYGFACCFSYSLLRNGIQTPETYSPDSINNILKSIDYADSYSSGDKPNVIMVQLESFFDPSYLDVEGISFSEEVIPNFKRLKSEYTSGFLKVPSFGGGTANTEFEVLTQLDIRNFGLGEYPYTTVLKEDVCESVGYDLKKNGYATHALHDHTATFYDRNIVYKNLGFDSFTPIEYMIAPERNPLGWAKDAVLSDEIVKALDSTEESDFVFAVSVQGHGQYPSEYGGELPIKVSGVEDKEMRTNLEYYLLQIHEMDEFIGEFTDRLSERAEKMIVVFYGDHLPCLKLGELNTSQIGNYPVSCDRFSTEYVVWSNFNMDKADEDLPAYKLSSKVLDSIGVHTGVVTQLNQKSGLSEDTYRAYSKICAYDMLYGDRIISKLMDLKPADMRLGVEDIKITEVKRSGAYALISGENFTEYSVITVDSKEEKTTYMSPELLRISSKEIYSGAKICVEQKSDNTVLGVSEEYVY